MVARLMASITLKDIPPDLHARLRVAADKNHRSMQREIIACLEAATARVYTSKTEMLEEAAKLRKKLPFVDHRIADRLKRAGRK